MTISVPHTVYLPASYASEVPETPRTMWPIAIAHGHPPSEDGKTVVEDTAHFGCKSWKSVLT